MTGQKVDLQVVLAIVEKIRQTLPGETMAITAEYAALLFYCSVAEGVGKFPEHLRLQRALLVADRGAQALVRAITSVGMMTEAQVAVEIAVLQQ